MSPTTLALTIGANPSVYGTIHTIVFNKQEKHLAYIFADNKERLPTLFGEGLLNTDKITSNYIGHLFTEAVNFPSKKHGSWIRFAEFDTDWSSRLGLIYNPPYKEQPWSTFSILTIPQLQSQAVDGLVSPGTLCELYGVGTITHYEDQRWYTVVTGPASRRVFFLGNFQSYFTIHQQLNNTLQG